MIFCETAGNDQAAFDTLAVFVSQARAHGLPVAISESSVPEAICAAHEFDVTPFLSHASPKSGDKIILLATDKVCPERAGQLRELTKGHAIECLGYGQLDDRQAQITAASRLAYALGREPDLESCDEKVGLPCAHIPIFGVQGAAKPRRKPTVGLFFPDLEAADARASLRGLSLSQEFNLEIVTNGVDKKKWIDSDGYKVPIWHLGELLPRAMASRFDVAVFFSKPVSWPRFQMLFANLTVRGAALVDATMDQLWHRHMPEVIPGPVRLGDMDDWIKRSVIPNLDGIRTEIMQSALAQSFCLPKSLAQMQEPQPDRPRSRKTGKPSVLFVPTNGVGLGHAKRCSLIADEMREKATPSFAAFPSCIGMLTASGFDTLPLVSRTSHRAGHDNDVTNFARLKAAASEAAAMVFDGGYVFDSVMRAAADNDKPSIWVRRGLWQASQNNQVALDRQKTFTRIVVPTEAFDELNAQEETTSNVVKVGPIVQRIDLNAGEVGDLRASLAERLDIQGKKLVITMLGGGVAADRRAQINTICSHLSGQDDVMHLLVVWPTATTDPGWFHYPNTRVVQSIHASALIPLADLFISAIGYNSFHEAMYGQVPTIFIPQMASFMDDQRARGKAAADRELALLIEPWELLSLTHAIDDCLGERGPKLREKLRSLNLPEPGSRAAAQQILEVVQ
jgi:UDP:flavonoid glycosyltransferase YjiC (YdhE family)